ncbi:hypothetical protein MTR67_018839 [Solanum verrucosum]|uniref:RNase H type-1 domain-containing protein n=1 Tax=Solanum verrucosum TaxID=315347 RepID=A0AAF0QKE3_SOLVR|nr:hypothetical protein MTR67_018839 [Solanum verrucosum]
METDSLTMKNVLEGMWEVHWEISLEVKWFKQLRNNGVIRVEYVLREGNQLADYFANMGAHFVGTKEYNNIQEVPLQGRRIINMEKDEVPSLRIHKCQNKGYGCT